jgi:hypothetical protein
VVPDIARMGRIEGGWWVQMMLLRFDVNRKPLGL